jgi:hypothetical protein
LIQFSQNHVKYVVLSAHGEPEKEISNSVMSTTRGGATSACALGDRQNYEFWGMGKYRAFSQITKMRGVRRRNKPGRKREVRVVWNTQLMAFLVQVKIWKMRVCIPFDLHKYMNYSIKISMRIKKSFKSLWPRSFRTPK